MGNFTRHFGCAIATGALVLAGLAGCGGSRQAATEPQAEPEPTTAMELLERYNKQENKDNYHMAISMDMKVSMGEFELPVGVSMDIDRAKSDCYGTMSITSSLTGDEPMESQMYITKSGESWTQYTSSDEGNTWISTDVESSTTSETLVNEKVFKDAEFAKADDGYTVTVTGDKIQDVLSSMGSNDYTGMLGDDSQAMEDVFKQSKMVYTFNKDCLPTSVTFNMDYAAQTGEDENALISLSGSMQLNMNVTFSNYGTVDASKVAVPAEVKESATSTGDAINLDDLGNMTFEDTENATAA